MKAQVGEREDSTITFITKVVKLARDLPCAEILPSIKNGFTLRRQLSVIVVVRVRDNVVKIGAIVSATRPAGSRATPDPRDRASIVVYIRCTWYRGFERIQRFERIENAVNH